MPAVTVRLPIPLRPYVDGRSEVGVTAATAGGALAALVQRYPELRRHLFDDGGRLRAFVNVYRNEEDIRWIAGEHTPVRPGDVLSVVPSIAGG